MCVRGCDISKKAERHVTWGVQFLRSPNLFKKDYSPQEAENAVTSQRKHPVDIHIFHNAHPTIAWPQQTLLQETLELERTTYNINNFCQCKLCPEEVTWAKVWKKKLRLTSETQVNVYQTTRCHVPEDGNPHSKCCNNFNSQTWKKQNDDIVVHSVTERNDSTSDASTDEVL